MEENGHPISILLCVFFINFFYWISRKKWIPNSKTVWCFMIRKKWTSIPIQSKIPSFGWHSKENWSQILCLLLDILEKMDPISMKLSFVWYLEENNSYLFCLLLDILEKMDPNSYTTVFCLIFQRKLYLRENWPPFQCYFVSKTK